MSSILPLLEEKSLKVALFQFLFPFSLNNDCQNDLKTQLKKDGFIPFKLNNTDLETAFYGPGYRVSHLNLERYYLPFTNNVIFPHEESEEAFLRYSLAVNLDCQMQLTKRISPCKIHSVDVVLCPFDLGFITIRVELPCEVLTCTEALEFVSRFRKLQNMTGHVSETYLLNDGKRFNEIEDFIFNVLVPGMLPFLDKSELKETYFEKLPFFVDERMYVQGLLSFTEGTEMTPVDLFRASQADGVDYHGNPYVSSTNTQYIERYVKTHVYDRWGPETYYMTTETSFFCVTTSPADITTDLANHMYGVYYYALLINLFYKIVLLKLSMSYSHLQLDRNQEKTGDLIRAITLFSAKYYFMEIISQSQGKEIFVLVRNHLGTDELFADVKKTLADLYKYQDNYASKSRDHLLLILTMYTVISGIYGMNQVIEDLKGPIDWTKFADYSVFQYFAVIVTISGILISCGLGVSTLLRFTKDSRRNK